MKRKEPLPEEAVEGLDASAIGRHHTSLLIRLTDDYLLLTTRPHLARWFARTMAAGLPRWGCETNPNKSRVNFHAPVPPPADGVAGQRKAGPAAVPRFDDAAVNGAAASCRAEPCTPPWRVTSPLTNDCAASSPRVAAHAPWLPWCGFLLHPETLELRSCYDRCVIRRLTRCTSPRPLTPGSLRADAAFSSGTSAPHSRSAPRASTGSGCSGA